MSDWFASKVKLRSMLGYINSQGPLLDTSVTGSAGLTQTAQGANNIVWAATMTSSCGLYTIIHIELKL